MTMRIAAQLLLAWAVLSGATSGQARTDRASFRVVGYYSLRAATTADPATVPFDRLTHVNLSFLNPDASGAFTQDLSGLSTFVEAARQRDVKVLIAIGGGGDRPQYRELLKPERRGALVERLVQIAVTSNLDGIDVDLEGGAIDENYEPFVVDLGAALRKQRKIMTAAIAVFYKDQLTDRALAEFDFVNIMSYDHTGPWRPERPGPHSTFEHAADALEYFGTVRRIPASRMVLGVPFYGYGYGPELTSPPATMTFKDIVSAFPGSELVDQWTRPDGKIMYYNGLPTIRRKTTLAREKASGIMIWQLLGDASDDRSLLGAINEVAYGRR
jgi:GH18 family chitinase